MLVTGAGPIGLLAALFAMRVAEEVHVIDRADDGPKPGLVGDLGAIYHDEPLDRIEERFDVVMECTGDVDLMMAVAGVTNPNGIICRGHRRRAGVSQQRSGPTSGAGEPDRLRNGERQPPAL